MNARPVRTVLLWIVTVLVAFGMGAPGLAKFLAPIWPKLFTQWGYPLWFMYVVGVIEVAGAIGLLIPRLAAWAALMLIPIMLGATATQLRFTPGAAWATPFVQLILLGIIATARWKARVRVGAIPHPSHISPA